MICKNCQAEIKDDAKFCNQCGADMEQISKEPIDFTKIFIDPKEKNIAVLGSSFLRNLLTTGELSNGSCLLSDKRVYFKGKCYNREGGRLTKTIEESTIDLKDITASGFSETKKIGLLILGWLFLILTGIFFVCSMNDDDFLFLFIPGMLVTIITFIAYSLSKIKLFFIAFAGGKLAFKASDYSNKEMQDFQKALRVAIDDYYKNK